MTLVRIVKHWDYPDLMRQTPNSQGIWDDINFTLDEVENCDYLIILNNSNKPIKVNCPHHHVWFIIQEPPNGWAKQLHINPDYSFRMFTSNTTRSSPEYIYSQPAIPWIINKTYNELVGEQVPEKTKTLSWITSNLKVFEGHFKRMQFMEKIQNKIEYDLFGRGFKEIPDKWDGLASYKYSLAIENFSNEYYWTEKIADCFLSYTMPIYYGCERITDYFPEEAIIQIDINSETVVEEIKQAISANRWSLNFDAIVHARELVLNKYQIFPFLTNQIKQFESTQGRRYKKESLLINPRKISYKNKNIIDKITNFYNKLRN